MAEENPRYEEVLKENEDLLLRNSELELENSILKEKNGRSAVPPPPPPTPPPPPPQNVATCPPEPDRHGEDADEMAEDDFGTKINIQLDISEGAKIVKIKTDKAKLMYTVSFIVSPDGNFIVKVWKFGNLLVPAEIVRNVFPPDRKKDATMLFRKLREDYTNFVKAETSKVDPRKIFDDCVDYRLIDPDCCQNCRYGTKEEIPEKKGIKPRKPRTICVNRKNISQYERVLKGYCKIVGNPPSGDMSCAIVPSNPELSAEYPLSAIPFEAHYNPNPYPFGPTVPPVEIEMKVVTNPRGICRNYVRGDAPPSSERYEDPRSFEFDKDLMVVIGNMVDDKIQKVSQEDVVVYCGDSVDTAGSV